MDEVEIGMQAIRSRAIMRVQEQLEQFVETHLTHILHGLATELVDEQLKGFKPTGILNELAVAVKDVPREGNWYSDSGGNTYIYTWVGRNNINDTKVYEWRKFDAVIGVCVDSRMEWTQTPVNP